MSKAMAVFALFRRSVLVCACLVPLAIVGCTRGEEGGFSLGVSYSTYLGGSRMDDCDGIAVDRGGNSYLACHVSSQDLPTTHELVSDQAGAIGRGAQDVIVAKLDPSGSHLVYLTRVAGSRSDGAFRIAVDSTGSAYVIGRTSSADFPTTEGALQRTFGGGSLDVFILKLDPSGSVVYSTLLGGQGLDRYGGITVDHAGNAYVTGWTDSDDFPISNPVQRTNAGGFDAFVAKLDPTGSSLIYSTYLGGEDEDRGGAIAVGSDGSTYVMGATQSEDFPTANPYQPHFGGGAGDAFIAKLDPTGSSLVYSTYLGGSGREDMIYHHAIAVDAAGSVYVAGNTESSDFPTLNPLQAKPGGGMDLFVTKLDPTGSALVYSTYLGGSDDEDVASASGVGFAVDADGNAYVATRTRSLDFPITNPLRPTLQDWRLRSAVAKLDPQGSALVWSTYLPGRVEALALGLDGSVYVTGQTASQDFPVRGPLQAALGGMGDIFVTKISERHPVASVLVDSLPTTPAVAEITDLGALSGPHSGARGINGSGVVVGERARSPVLWTAEGGIVELGGYGAAHAVNAQGQVVGGSSNRIDGAGRSFLWTAEAGSLDFVTLVPALSDVEFRIRARAIDPRGVVVGSILILRPPFDLTAFSWSSDGGLVQLGTLGGRTSEAWGLNASGQIVGESATPRQGVRAVLWSGDEVRDLGTLGGSISRAFGINDSGHVVGESLTAAGEKHAFLWTDEEGMLDLGTLGGPTSAALDVNNPGHVVGYSTNAAGDRRPFLWTADEGMADLGTLGGPEGIARAVNDRGQIVGESLTASGARHATLWVVPARSDR